MSVSVRSRAIPTPAATLPAATVRIVAATLTPAPAVVVPAATGAGPIEGRRR
jgi:hypothetical protein